MLWDSVSKLYRLEIREVIRCSGKYLSVFNLLIFKYFLSLKWWAHQDLNLGPTDYESAALTN